MAAAHNEIVILDDCLALIGNFISRISKRRLRWLAVTADEVDVLTVFCVSCLGLGGALCWRAHRVSQRVPSLELVAGSLIVSGLVLLGAALRTGF